jgi:hypothetical protein
MKMCSGPTCWRHARVPLIAHPVWPELPIVLFVLSLWPGLGAAFAQYSTRAYTPSRQSSAVNFGVSGVGRSANGYGVLGDGGSSPYSYPRQFASSPLSSPMSGRAARSMAGASGGAASGYGKGQLLGRPSSTLLGGLPADRVDWRSPSALGRTYESAVRGNWSMGMPTPVSTSDEILPFRQWAPPAPDVVGKNPGSQPAGSGPVASGASEVRLADMVSRQLAARRQLHMDNGWEAFKKQRYEKAYGLFNLAEGVSLDSPTDRAEARLAMVYASVAAEQYAQALGALGWLVGTYPRLATSSDRPFSSLIPDLRARYGPGQDLTDHLRALSRFVLESEKAHTSASAADAARAGGVKAQAKALQILFLAGLAEERGQALSEANRLAAIAPPPWNKLRDLLQGLKSDQGGTAGSPAPADSTPTADAEFPFNLFKEPVPGQADRPSGAPDERPGPQ